MKEALLRRCRIGSELLLDCRDGSGLDMLHQKCYWLVLNIGCAVGCSIFQQVSRQAHNARDSILCYTLSSVHDVLINRFPCDSLLISSSRNISNKSLTCSFHTILHYLNFLSSGSHFSYLPQIRSPR